MAVIGCTTMWMTSCKHAPDAQMKASYATMKVSTADKELTTSYSATIRGRQNIDVYPQVSGTIERLCVTEGQVVKKITFCHRPSPLQGSPEDSPGKRRSGKSSFGYRRTELQQY